MGASAYPHRVDRVVAMIGGGEADALLIGVDGTPVTAHAVGGDRGHIDGVISLRKVETELRAFLE